MTYLKKALLFLHTLYAWLVIFLVFTSHYCVASLITLIPFKNKEAIWYALAKKIVNIGFLVGFIRVSVSGTEHFPKDKNIVVVSNHQSLFDTAVLLTVLPYRVVFFAKKELKKIPILAQDIEKMGHVYVDRTQVSKAMEQLLKMEVKLKQGLNVFIFPEGTRSPGAMKHATSGVVQLALKTQAPLLPVGITGTEHLGHWLRTLHPTGRIRVNIGAVFSLPSVEGKPNKEVIESLVDTVMHRVATLLPATYQGVYEIGHDAVTTDAQAQSEGIEKGGTPLA